MFDAGNSLNRTGYSCTLPLMIKTWRNAFAAANNQTDPLLPFYIVGLHDGGEEGWGGMMGAFRYAQTAGYGSLPNPEMPNTHLVEAYDAGDRQYTHSCTRRRRCRCSRSRHRSRRQTKNH